MLVFDKEQESKVRGEALPVKGSPSWGGYIAVVANLEYYITCTASQQGLGIDGNEIKGFSDFTAGLLRVKNTFSRIQVPAKLR